MGTQHRPSKKMRFKVDDEWEHLDAPMFCDFLAPEFVGNRLGGSVTDESSSSSFFTHCQTVHEGGPKKQSPQLQPPHATATCQPMLASPECAENHSDASPESINSAQVCAASDTKRRSAHSTAQQDQSRTSTKRASGKHGSRRSQQGSMGPAGYPLTPVSDAPSHLSESSGTAPGPSLTPGLHEVPALVLEKCRISAPSSAFYARGVHGCVAAAAEVPQLESLTSPHSTPGDDSPAAQPVQLAQPRHNWKAPTPTPADEQPQPTEAPGTDEVHHTWEAIPHPAANMGAQHITLATQEALRSHALSLGTSYVSSAAGINTHDGSSFISFAGFSDNTFPESSATLDQIGAPSGGSTISSLPGPSFFSVMGDSGQSLNPPQPPSPLTCTTSQLSQLSHVSSSSIAANTSPGSPALSAGATAVRNMHAHASAARATASPRDAVSHQPMIGAVPHLKPAPNAARMTPSPQSQQHLRALTVAEQESGSNMSSRSPASTAPSPSMLTVAEKIKRHEAATSVHAPKGAPGVVLSGSDAQAGLPEPHSSSDEGAAAKMARGSTFVRCAATSVPARRTRAQPSQPPSQPSTAMCASTRTCSQPARARKALTSPDSHANPRRMSPAVPPLVRSNKSAPKVPGLNMSAMRSASANPASRSSGAASAVHACSLRTTVDYHADDKSETSRASPRLPSPPSSSCPSPGAEISLVATDGSHPFRAPSPQHIHAVATSNVPPAFECAPLKPHFDGSTMTPPIPLGPCSYGDRTRKPHKSAACAENSYTHAMCPQDSCNESMLSVSCESSLAQTACDVHMSKPQQRHMFLREHHSESGASMLRARATQSARSSAQPSAAACGRTPQAPVKGDNGSRTPRQRGRDDGQAPRTKSAHTVGSHPPLRTLSGSAAASTLLRRKAQPSTAKFNERDSTVSHLSGSSQHVWEEDSCGRSVGKKLAKKELESVVDRLSKPKQGPRGLTTEEMQLQEAQRGRQRAFELSQKAEQSWRRLQKSTTPPPITAEETCPPGALMAERSALPAFGRSLRSQSSVFCVSGPGLRPENSMPDAAMFSAWSRRPASASSHSARSQLRPATVRRERSRNGPASFNSSGSCKPAGRASHDCDRPPLHHHTAQVAPVTAGFKAADTSKPLSGSAIVPPLNLNLKSVATHATDSDVPSSTQFSATTANPRSGSSRTHRSDRSANTSAPRPRSCGYRPLSSAAQRLNTNSHSQDCHTSKSPRPSPRNTHAIVVPPLNIASSSQAAHRNPTLASLKSPRDQMPRNPQSPRMLHSPRGCPVETHPAPGVRALPSPREARPYTTLSPRDSTTARFLSPRDTPGASRMYSPRNRDLPKVGPSPRTTALVSRASSAMAPSGQLSGIAEGQHQYAPPKPRMHVSASAPPPGTWERGNTATGKGASPGVYGTSNMASPVCPPSPAMGSGQLSPSNTPRLSGVASTRADWGSPAESALDHDAYGRNLPTVPSQLSNEASAGTIRTGGGTTPRTAMRPSPLASVSSKRVSDNSTLSSGSKLASEVSGVSSKRGSDSSLCVDATVQSCYYSTSIPLIAAVNPGQLSAQEQEEVYFGSPLEGTHDTFMHGVQESLRPTNTDGPAQPRSHSSGVPTSTYKGGAPQAGSKTVLSSEEIALQTAERKRAELQALRHANAKSWSKARGQSSLPASNTSTSCTAAVSTGASNPPKSTTSQNPPSRRCYSARSTPSLPAAHTSRPNTARHPARSAAPSHKLASGRSDDTNACSSGTDTITSVPNSRSLQQFSHPLASNASRPPLPRLHLGLLVSSPTHVAYAQDGQPVPCMQHPTTLSSVASSDGESDDADSDTDECTDMCSGARNSASEPCVGVATGAPTSSNGCPESLCPDSAERPVACIEKPSAPQQPFSNSKGPGCLTATKSHDDAADCKKLKRKGPEMYKPLPNALRNQSPAFHALETTTCTVLNNSAALNRRTMNRTHAPPARAPTVPVGPNLATEARASGDLPPSHLTSAVSISSVNPFRSDPKSSSLNTCSMLRAESSAPSVAAASAAFVFHAHSSRGTTSRRQPVAALRRSGKTTTSSLQTHDSAPSDSVVSHTFGRSTAAQSGPDRAPRQGSHHHHLHSDQPSRSSVAAESDTADSAVQVPHTQSAAPGAAAAACMRRLSPVVSPAPQGTHPGIASEGGASSTSPTLSTAATNAVGGPPASPPSCPSTDRQICPESTVACSPEPAPAPVATPTPTPGPTPALHLQDLRTEGSFQDFASMSLTPTSPPMILGAGGVSTTTTTAAAATTATTPPAPPAGWYNVTMLPDTNPASAQHASQPLPSSALAPASGFGRCSVPSTAAEPTREDVALPFKLSTDSTTRHSLLSLQRQDSGKENHTEHLNRSPRLSVLEARASTVSPLQVTHLHQAFSSSPDLLLRPGDQEKATKLSGRASTPRVDPRVPPPALESHPCPSIGTMLTASTTDTAAAVLCGGLLLGAPSTTSIRSGISLTPTNTPNPKEKNPSGALMPHHSSETLRPTDSAQGTTTTTTSTSQESTLQGTRGTFKQADEATRQHEPPSFALSNTSSINIATCASKLHNASSAIDSSLSMPLTSSASFIAVASEDSELSLLSDNSMFAAILLDHPVHGGPTLASPRPAAAADTSAVAGNADTSAIAGNSNSSAIEGNNPDTTAIAGNNDTSGMPETSTPRAKPCAGPGLPSASSSVFPGTLDPGLLDLSVNTLQGRIMQGFAPRVSLSTGPMSTGLQACLPFNSSPALVGFATPSAPGIPVTTQTAEERALCLQRSLAQDPYLPLHRRLSLSAFVNSQTPCGVPPRCSLDGDASLTPLATVASAGRGVLRGGSSSSLMLASGGGGPCGHTVSKTRMSLTLSTASGFARQQRVQRLSLGNQRAGTCQSGLRRTKSRKLSASSLTIDLAPGNSQRNSLPLLGHTLSDPFGIPEEAPGDDLRSTDAADPSPSLSTPSLTESPVGDHDRALVSAHAPHAPSSHAAPPHDSPAEARASKTVARLPHCASPLSCKSIVTGESSLAAQDAALDEFIRAQDLL